MSKKQINRLYRDQDRVITLTDTRLDQLHNHQKRLNEIHEVFKHCKQELSLDNKINDIKKSLLEIAEHLTDQINKQEKRLKASEKTQKHLKRLSNKLDKNPPKRRKVKQSSQLIANPFHLN